MSVRLYVHLYVCTSICMSVHPSVQPAVCLYIHLYVHLYVCTSICMSVHPSVCLYVHLYVCTSICMSVRPDIPMYIHLYVCTSICPYVCPEILCVQCLLHPLMDFVHTHTQWPTWHEDDRKELWDLVSLFKNSSLSTFHQVMRVYVRTFEVNPLHDCITVVLR